MPFLKDEEGLACERERKALQEEEHPMQRQSQGMNRIKGREMIRRLKRWRSLLSDSKQLQGKLCQGLGTVRQS